MKWSDRALRLRDIYVEQGANAQYLVKYAEQEARNDESPVVYRTHVKWVRLEMK